MAQVRRSEDSRNKSSVAIAFSRLGISSLGISSLLGPLLAALLLGSPAWPQEATPSASEAADEVADEVAGEATDLAAQFEQLEPRFQQWLRSVRGLITQPELEYFLASSADFRRETFQQEFWKVRDPDPVTPQNELQRRWQEVIRQSPDQSFADARWMLFLLNGPPGRWPLPDGRQVSRCFSRTREIEIWFYGGSERVSRRFPVILYQRAADTGYEVWRPSATSLRAAQRSRLPTTDISLLCADDLLGYASREISRVSSYDQLIDQVLTPPMPPNEWLATLIARTTDLPEGAETFDAEVEFSFPARNQSRTAVETLARIPRDQAPGRELEGVVFHNFLVTGEILREDSLFESFRYRFDGPTPDGTESLPIGFTRYLRPGAYTVRLLIEDLYAGSYSQLIRQLEVPSPEGLPPIEPPPTSVITGPSIELLEPAGSVHAGLVRFDARARGELDRVAFFLDDRRILSKRSPPYSVEIDLGTAPAPHRVRVVGYRGDQEVATDQLWLNQGAQRFRVRMIEPRAGGIYPGGLTVRLEIDTPDGSSPDRVDLYVNDTQATTITEPPYSRGLVLPGDRVALVRAVAWLADGTSTEASVVVNTADFANQVLDQVSVQLVEVPFAILDANQQPIVDLEPSEVRLFDGDQRVEIQSFHRTEELPIRAVLLVDRSASMEPRMNEVSRAALGFAEQALASDRDQVALLSFADDTASELAFSSSPERVELALAGLDPGGGTALLDAIAVALNEARLDPADGQAAGDQQRAVVLFTDGQDENSALGFEQVVESAQRTGVPIYAIGLATAFPDRQSRRSLERLADETGGFSRFVDSVTELPSVYQEILGELRSRYLVTFQVDPATPEGLRQLRIEVDRRGARVRARSAYWKQ